MMTSDRLEYTSPQDPYLNFLGWPYLPAAPAENKFRSVNLLFHSFAFAGIDERAFRILQTLRDAIGLFRTVWGVKWLGSRLVWELYFYDYKRREREISITRILEALKPLVRSAIHVNEELPYFMFSIDLNTEVFLGNLGLKMVHMYIGNPGCTALSGVAYAIGHEETALENLYFFFDAKQQLQQAAEKVCCSVHVDATQVNIDQILWPDLRICENISVANKQHNDAVYFSGVSVDQLLLFLNRLDYPSEIISFVEGNRTKLDHLLYDVGFDYIAQDSKLLIVKSGYYGVF